MVCYYSRLRPHAFRVCRRARPGGPSVRYGPVWPAMASYGLLWSAMVRHGPPWPAIALWLLWSAMVQYGLLWFTMVPYGPPWPDPPGIMWATILKPASLPAMARYGLIRFGPLGPGIRSARARCGPARRGPRPPDRPS